MPERQQCSCDIVIPTHRTRQGWYCAFIIESSYGRNKAMHVGCRGGLHVFFLISAVIAMLASSFVLRIFLLRKPRSFRIGDARF